ncbi:P-loop containing nucleoside triphosphate hydrolase protein [Phlyctochytrium arcticum]|nr:P-loop containing nucleoside triphosphate hydrolase protein [Phlyctochytrium arcticum]
MSTYSAAETALRRSRKKLVIVGDGACGKTSLLMVQSGEPFPEAYVPTIFENYISRVCVSKERMYELSLWDTAGQEDYDRLRPLSYPDTDVVLLAFDVTNRDSFDAIREKWHPETNHFLHNVPRILVGTKTDLRHHPGRLEDLKRLGLVPITFEEGLKLANEIGATKYFETSAKSFDGVHELFVAAAKLANKPKRKVRSCSWL